MANIILSFKVLLILLYQFAIPMLATFFAQNDKPPVIWFHVSISALFLPEFGFFFNKTFRDTILRGFEMYEVFEDEIGKRVRIARVDMKSLMIHYSTTVFVRTFGILALSDIWYDISHVSIWWKIIMLLSAFGMEGFNVIKYIIQKKV